MTATTVKSPKLATAITQKSTSQMGVAWRRLRRHKLAMFGLIFLGIIVLLSVAAQWIAPYNFERINLDQRFASFFTPDNAGGTATHVLGTDGLGRDILTRLLYAGRISLSVALIVTVLSIFLGTVIGATAGAFGGTVDTILMRITDVFLTLPQLPLLLIISSSLRQFVALQNFLGSNLSVVIIVGVLVIFGWMGDARLVRGSVLSLRSQDFISASRALGSSNARIIFLHLVPNSMAPIIVAATLAFGGVIIAESALSFLGFGIMPPVPTWGNMLNEARNSPLVYLFVQALSPGICIFLTVLCVNFLGDGLRDALDPRLKL